MFKPSSILPFLFLGMLSCIGEDVIDDYVNPDLRITNPIISITVGSTYQFKSLFFDESGTKIPNPKLSWALQPADLGTINEKGVFNALKPGVAVVIVKAQGLQNQTVKSQTEFEILAPPPVENNPTGSQTGTESETTEKGTTNTTEAGSTNTKSGTTNSSDTASSTTASNNDNTETTSNTTEAGTTETESDTTDSTETSETSESNNNDTTNNGVTVAVTYYEGEIKSTSSYVLEGNYRYEHNGTQIILSLDETYRASTALPGLYVYLANNPNTVVGAYEIGAVTVFEGAHQYELPVAIEIMDYKYILYWCKPFNVKVGEAQIF